MSWPKLFMVALVWMLCLPEAGQAHRVNIFAWVQGSQIVGECAFNRGSGVRHGCIVVLDAVNDAQLVECRTDDQGHFQFPIPEAAVRAGHGIRIVIMAGEGHQNSTEVPLEDLRGGAAAGEAEAPGMAAGSGGMPEKTPAVPAAEAVGGSAGPSAAPAAVRSQAVAAEEAGLTAARVQQIVETALDRRLEPIYRYLAAREEAGPSLKDIVGGIGWILGLAGIAAYCRRRS